MVEISRMVEIKMFPLKSIKKKKKQSWKQYNRIGNPTTDHIVTTPGFPDAKQAPALDMDHIHLDWLRPSLFECYALSCFERVRVHLGCVY